ncbi:MAG TPA: AMP-binding protein [Solirubrobacteraceae bacterium]|jgi:acyl-CoA synthetase (AMP-forming)/AMP-acid ligase II|nr:AMP-binding protein [Solirubrobacteraceae bacterium]
MSPSLEHRLEVARTLLGTHILSVERPDKVVRALATLRRWGSSSAAAYAISAIRYPERLAIVDERGALTFAEVDARTNALARALREAGVREQDGVALMCRNHRGYIEATVACAKLGASVLYLNTAFAGPQITDVLRREAPVALIYDEEFEGLVHEGSQGMRRFVSWREPQGDGAGREDPWVEELIAHTDQSPLQPPTETGRVVILTSGTTGTPKGAKRKQPDSLEPAAALFSKIPLKARETTVIAAPMFHSWGYGHFTLALPLASTLVLRRRFDPEQTLADIARYRASALAVVPVMLQRIMELPAETRERYDTSALRIISASGSVLPGELATRVMDAFGEVLYNLYGSTEVAWATIATPEDLRAAPGTAGRPPLGTVVKILDADGHELPQGQRGRIFAANEMVFDGYTGGGGKEIVGGLMSTGDMGHFDAGGRLFVDGRDDEMIVSGGENVFPREVEDLLATHPQIEEAAVIGVDDEQFGQRLKAFVVARDRDAVSDEEIKEYVKHNLARYKVPREVVFMDSLPRNATGKVLKRELSAAAD